MKSARKLHIIPASLQRQAAVHPRSQLQEINRIKFFSGSSDEVGIGVKRPFSTIQPIQWEAASYLATSVSVRTRSNYVASR